MLRKWLKLPPKGDDGDLKENQKERNLPKKNAMSNQQTSSAVKRRSDDALAHVGAKKQLKSAEEAMKVEAKLEEAQPGSAERTAATLARVLKNPERLAARLDDHDDDNCDNIGDSLETRTMGKSWLPHLTPEFQKEYFGKLKTFLCQQYAQEKTIFPSELDIYSWSRYCSLEEVFNAGKPLMVNVEPICSSSTMHHLGQAHGLCFSVRDGIAVPPSLVNIFKELDQDDAIPFQKPSHGCLVGWAKQGVLLLNAVLTVEAHKANSHQGKGWERFTDAIIKLVNLHCQNVVFLLWGNYAAKKGACIDKKKHCVLQSVHPSPLSAHRGFFGCRHFSKANRYLEEHGKPCIDWNQLQDLGEDSSSPAM